MATFPTHAFRVDNATNFIDSLWGEEGENLSYIFIGKPTAWPDENRPPVPDNSIKSFYDTYQQILSMKRILGRNAYNMIRRYTWNSGTTYDIYRHDYSIANTSFSGATQLSDCVWYVLNQKNDIYVCLDNNYNQASIVEPQNQTYDPFFTSDGYQWMKLFSIEQAILFDFSTNNYLPITTDGANINTKPRTDGEILTVLVDFAGDGYTINPGGVPNEVTNYYCKIVGDGEGAVANVRVIPPPVDNPNIGQGIGAVRIVRPGKGYTYANLDFKAGEVYQSLEDLDEDKDALDPRGDGNFRSTCIISPPGGWGTNIPQQLFGATAGVFSKFDYNTSDFFPDVTFRQIGILLEPSLGSNVPDNAGTLSGVFGLKVLEIEGQPDFIMGETIYQQNYIEELRETHTAKGMIVGWDETEKIIRYIQIPSEHVSDDGNLYQFGPSNFIHGQTSRKIVEATSYNGSLAGLTFENGFADVEWQRYTGDMIYLSNITPVRREETQTEKIALIINF